MCVKTLTIAKKTNYPTTAATNALKIRNSSKHYAVTRQLPENYSTHPYVPLGKALYRMLKIPLYRSPQREKLLC